MKITKIYTRTGDLGMTSLVGGVRIKKSDIRLEAYGTVDELSSQLGMLAEMLGEDIEKDVVIGIQNNLFNVCTSLATDQSTTQLPPSAKLAEGVVALMEKHIDELNGRLPERLGFILPGGCMAACQAHICRTVCRRAERRITSLADVAIVDEEIQQYVNRLSDYLFVLAKIINFNENRQEIVWEKERK